MESSSREGSPVPSARPNRPSVKLNTKPTTTTISDHLSPTTPMPCANSPTPAGILRRTSAYPESTAAETGQLPRSPSCATRRPTMHPVASNPLSRSSSQPSDPRARRQSYSRSASMLAQQSGNIMMNFEKNFERRGSMAVDYTRRASIAVGAHELYRRASVVPNWAIDTTNKFVIGALEKFFLWWGKIVATYPLVIIIVCAILTGACCTGLYWWRTEADAEKLWLPDTSPFIYNKKWKLENFANKERLHISMLRHEENVLTPEGMLKLLEIHQKVNAVIHENKTFSDFCLKIPITNFLVAGIDKKKRRRKRRQTSGEGKSPAGTTRNVEVVEDPVSQDYYPEEYFDFYSLNTDDLTDSSKIKEAIKKGVNDANEGDGGDTVVEDAAGDEGDDYDGYEDYNFNFYQGWSEEEEEKTTTKKPKTQKEKDEEEEEDDKQSSLPPEIYCDLLETAADKCAEYSLLELWKFKEDKIRSLTQQDIIDAINLKDVSPYFGYDTDFTDYLGGIVRNDTGHVIAAKAARLVWVATFDPSKVVKSTDSLRIEIDPADPFTMQWEEKLISELLDYANNTRNEVHLNNGTVKGFDLLLNVQRSFEDVASAGVFVDSVRMVIGYLVMFLYAMFVLGKRNKVEHRTYLALAGIVACFMGLMISLGLTMAFGFYYTTLHGILPFMALGIGIDDMFVVIQCFNNLPEEQTLGRSLKDRIALTMQHAGVAITVTSVTDVLAFGVGAITILPGLKVFCISSAIAIAAIFILQASWFVAFLTLDQMRIEALRDGLFPCCLVHKDFDFEENSGKEWSKIIITKVAEGLEYWTVRLGILAVTGTLLAFGIMGTLQIPVEFDAVLLLPADSYLRHFIQQNKEQFPASEEAKIYAGRVEYTIRDFGKIDRITKALDDVLEYEDILTDTNLWWNDLKSYLKERKGVSDWKDSMRDGTFRRYLSDFLHHEDGAQSKKDFKFEGDEEVECDEPAPQIRAVILGTIDYRDFVGPSEHIPARQRVRQIIDRTNLSSHSFSDSLVYKEWETDEVIGYELYRNIGLAMICIFVISLTMLADVKISLMVMACVILTMVDVTGYIFYWGLTIDTVSCMSVVLVVGLCVDYSAHIAHAFIVEKGSSYHRASEALISMGPAILNGGITTLIAIIFLGFSDSYAFIVFFKIFFLCVILGLFHGLLFLPVALILLGKDNGDDDGDDNDPYQIKGMKNMGFNLNENHGGFGGSAFGMNGKKGASQSWDLPDLDEESESVDGKSDSGSKRGSRSSSSTANNVAPNNQKDDGGGDA